MKERLFSLFLLLVAALVVLPLGTCGSYNNEKPVVALYHDKGVWLDGLIATERMLDWMRIGWREIDATELNDRGLAGFKIFWLPGGWAPDYVEKIRSSGRQAIRRFVQDGGIYVGVCAGAYYAANTVVWEGGRYSYPLGLFYGEAVGPEIYPWPHYGMAELEMDSKHPINRNRPEKHEWVLLYGGGHFVAGPGQGMAVIARYEKTGQPAIITFSYGRGRVLLLGVHPEIEEDSPRDGTYFAQQLADHGSDWPWMRAALAWLLKPEE